MQRIGVFPGSFDPFTKGHEAIVKRFIPLFDQVIVAIGINSTKKYMYDMESRIKHIQAIFSAEPSVKVEAYEGLTVDFCKKKEARYLLRGIRNTVDFEFEKAIGQMNKDLEGIETVLLLTDKETSAISSSIVREIKKNGGNITQFVTKEELLIMNRR